MARFFLDILAVKQHGVISGVEPGKELIIVVDAGRIARLSRREQANRAAKISQIDDHAKRWPYNLFYTEICMAGARCPDRRAVPTKGKWAAIKEMVEQRGAS